MPIETLVSRESFVRTYPKGELVMQQYLRALELYPSMSYYRIGHKIGRHPTTVKQWLIDDNVPKCMQGLERAIELNLVPLTRFSPKFQVINELIAWIYLSGSLGRDFGIGVFMDQQQADVLSSHIKHQLGINTFYDSSANRLTLNKGTKIVGRVLNALGLAKDSYKSRHDINLPAYLKSCLNHKSKRSSRYMALETFVRVMLQARKTDKDCDASILYLPTHYDKDICDQVSSDVLKVLQKVMPKAGLTKDNINIYYSKKRRYYRPQINLRKENLVRIRQHYSVLFSYT